MEELAGKNAVVVGGGQGIGRGIALALAREGMDVAVLDIEEHAAESVADEIRAQGVRAVGLRADVTNTDYLNAAAREVTHALGPVHVLSNNAGVVLPQGRITDMRDSDWRFVFEVNLFGVVNCVQAFLPQMRAHGRGGHIVNTSSTAGLVAIHDLEVGVYTASKYACNGYSEILRGELTNENIGVSVLCPGLIATDLSQTSARNRPDRFGGPSEAPPPMPAEMAAQAMAPEDVGPIVVRGIKANRLTILTHPEIALPLTQARFEGIRADGEAEAAER
ncbi:MAG: SDR family NAD(P)-dependent oxidoreductase [bacterium]|nr:SDR family NAD(P)-dependent oxidoreductase [bacterium]